MTSNEETKEVQFAILDKDFRDIENTSLIQRIIISMTVRFPKGMTYGDPALGEIFGVSPGRINHLINDLQEPKKIIVIKNPKSRWRKIFLNPENSTLLKIAKYQEKNHNLLCSKQLSKNCLLCYFQRSTLLFSAKSIKEVRKEKNKEGKLPNGNNIFSCKQYAGSKRFQKPTPAEVTEYAKSIDYQLDGSAFCDYYDSVGWSVGKKPMKDWRAAVRTWKTRNKADDITVDHWQPPTLEQVEQIKKQCAEQYAGESHGH